MQQQGQTESESQLEEPQTQQQLRTLVWQNGKVSADIPLEKVSPLLHDPHTLVWLDIMGDCSECESMLCDVFHLEHIVVQTMCEEKERAKFLERDNYFYLVVHGLVFNSATLEAMTPKLDIVFGQNYIITARRVSFEWLETLQKEAQENDPEEHIMSRA